MYIFDLEKSLKVQVDKRNEILQLISDYRSIHGKKSRYINENEIDGYGDNDDILKKYRKQLNSLKGQVKNKCAELLID